MLQENGSRLQGALVEHPAVKDVKNFYGLLLGFIQADGVMFPDNSQNPTGTVVVNITFTDGYPDAYRVPIMTPKINQSNGESADPEPGDQVVVGFVNGNFFKPMVVGFLPPPKNEIQGNATEHPRTFRQRSGTWEKIDKTGTRTVNVALDELKEVTRNWLVNVIDGITTIISKGRITLQSEGQVHLDGTGQQQVKGAVQGDCICPLIRRPHIMVSASVKASK